MITPPDPKLLFSADELFAQEVADTRPREWDEKATVTAAYVYMLVMGVGVTVMRVVHQHYLAAVASFIAGYAILIIKDWFVRIRTLAWQRDVIWTAYLMEIKDEVLKK